VVFLSSRPTRALREKEWFIYERVENLGVGKNRLTDENPSKYNCIFSFNTTAPLRHSP
jgi:hypothetical protein